MIPKIRWTVIWMSFSLMGFGGMVCFWIQSELNMLIFAAIIVSVMLIYAMLMTVDFEICSNEYERKNET